MKRFLSVVFLLSCLGCAKNTGTAATAASTGERRTAGDYYPLAVGNSWTYDAKFLGGDEERTVAIVRKDGVFFRDSMGGQLRLDPFGVRDEKRYLLREPIEVGTSWTNVVSVSSIERYRIVKVGHPCEAPAGKFEGCVTVESTNKADPRRSLVNAMTFAPGVGIVRIQVTLVDGKKQIPQATMALKKFELKEGAR